MQIGQKFTAKSKIDKKPVTFIYRGMLKNRDHAIEHVSGDPERNCEVDILWFENRKIKLI